MNQYLIYAWDGNDSEAVERRQQVRPLHLEGARQLKQTGNFVIGGAMLNDEGAMRGSMMVVQFETEEELRSWMDQEPYIQKGVWQKIEIHPFRVAKID